MTPYQAHRDARLIELDMIDCCELVFEDQPLPDYRPLLKKFAGRVGELADKLQKLEQLSVEEKKAAMRWELLYATQGVSIKDYPNNNSMNGYRFALFRDIPNGKKLLSQGKTLTEAADRALGFIK